MAHDVFISHASRDKSIADAVCASLESEGIRCWIAPRDVQAGKSFAGEVTRAIKNAKIMVLIFSAHSNNSEQVLREVQLAADGHVHIIQFRIEDVVANDDLKYFLSIPHWLDAIRPPLRDHLARLVSSIKPLLNQTAAPLPIAAPEPAAAPIAPVDSPVNSIPVPSAQPTQSPSHSKQWVVGAIILLIGVLLWLIVRPSAHQSKGAQSDNMTATSPASSVAASASENSSPSSSSTAATTVSNAVARNIRESQSYVDGGMTRLKNGDAQVATANFEHALQLDPTNARAYIGRGLAKHQGGDLDGALADFQKAAEIAPRNAMAHNNVGKVYLERGELDKALSELDRSIELNANHELAFANRGHVKMRKNDLAGASADFNRALQIDPKQVWALEGRGALELIQGQWRGAAADLQSRCEFEPANSDWARLLLWIAESHLGNKALAHRHLVEFRQGQPHAAAPDLNGRIADFLLGQITAENFLNFGQGIPGAEKNLEFRKCRIWMFAGMKSEARGDMNSAIGCFQNAIATDQTEMFDYLLAQAELKRLGGKN